MAYRFYNKDHVLQDVGLKEARELGLFPSVTSILSIIDKPGVNIWKVNTMKEVCMGLALNPELAHLTDDEFDAKVSMMYEHEITRAAKLGSVYHEAISECLENENKVLPMYIPQKTIGALLGFIQDNKIVPTKVEQSFVHESYGFAGTIDLIASWDNGNSKTAIIDWKTQRTKNGKFSFYKEWGVQLAAYCYGYYADPKPVDLVSVAISTTEPGLLKYKIWDKKQEMFDCFLRAIKLWESWLITNWREKNED